MQQYNPEIHKRRSIRLKGYDYSQAGLYFITICVQNKECLFGNIDCGEPVFLPNGLPKMILNDAGKMIEKWYYELTNKFPDIKCHEMIVMPNHFHCIIENVGADLRVCPNIDMPIGADLPVGADLRVCPFSVLASGQTHRSAPTTDITILHEHAGSPLYTVVQWFKTMSTNEYIRGVKKLGWQPFNGKLWQRNYYEHIIRNEQSYQNISNYISNNPAQWQEDKFYISKTKKDEK